MDDSKIIKFDSIKLTLMPGSNRQEGLVKHRKNTFFVF